MEVTKSGKIIGACDGKNASMRGLAPHLINLEMVKVSEQNLVDVAKLQRKMDEKFEYANHELMAQGFRDYLKRFMKGECCNLKKRYVRGEQQDCPMGVEQNEWDELVQYWGWEAQKKFEVMAYVRGVVMTISTYGLYVRGKGGTYGRYVRSGQASCKEPLNNYCNKQSC